MTSFLVAADGDACIIFENGGGGGDEDDGGEGEGEECPDLGRLCPSLTCDNGFVVDDGGCAICECQPSTCSSDDAAAPPRECNGFFDEARCQWICLGDECRADSDCPPNTVCVDGACRGLGLGCSSDADCGPGFRCEFGGGSDPPPPEGGGDEDAPDAAPAFGQCVQLPPCFSDADCAPGERCVPLDQAGALVAISSVCVADDGQQCSVDDDCALGERCQVVGCTGSCPACDDCTVLVTDCVATQVPCETDAQCRRGEVCLFDDAAARPCRDADGDLQCDDVVPDPIPQGFCGVPPVVTGCWSDDECGPGFVCRGVDECNCPAVCIDDGNGGCLPCDCEPLPGECAAVGPGDEECRDDAGCASGEKCVIYAVGCERACEIQPDGTEVCHPCDPIPVGRCEFSPSFCGSDADCGPGQYCELGVVCPRIAVICPDGTIATDVDGDGCPLECAAPPPCDRPEGCAPPAPPPPPAGICLDQPTDPCARVRCASDDVCIVDTAGNAACVENPCITVRCNGDTHCEVLQDGSALCIDNGPNCTSDANCAGGEVCSVSFGDCQGNPHCSPDGLCTDECWGFCIPR
jgi:hypothetical protein